MSIPKAYLEHIAIWVKDIHWHIRFFHDVFGMTMREVDGTEQQPSQYWTLGGMQFMSDPEFAGPEGRLGHLGMMCEDLPAALARARGFEGVEAMSQGDNWLRLPDGLAVEFIQASPASAVREALAVNARVSE